MEDYLEINYEKNLKMLNDAVKYCETDFLHDDLINILKSEDDLKKQLCIIEISSINSQEEADLIVSNLINHSGPIRETISYKILDLIQKNEYGKYFQTREIYDIFVKAVVDINPSVSRNMIEILKYIENPQYIYDRIIEELNKTVNELEEIKKNRSYVLNKKNFNIYWNLEALTVLEGKISPDKKLLEILQITSKSNDYTIREKTAKTAKTASEKNPEFNIILENLTQDTNVYVKKYIS